MSQLFVAQTSNRNWPESTLAQSDFLCREPRIRPFNLSATPSIGVLETSLPPESHEHCFPQQLCASKMLAMFAFGGGAENSSVRRLSLSFRCVVVDISPSVVAVSPSVIGRLNARHAGTGAIRAAVNISLPTK